eukprot:350065-Chlamydomonas_euryale.AAC.7
MHAKVDAFLQLGLAPSAPLPPPFDALSWATEWSGTLQCVGPKQKDEGDVCLGGTGWKGGGSCLQIGSHGSRSQDHVGSASQAAGPAFNTALKVDK